MMQRPDPASSAADGGTVAAHSMAAPLVPLAAIQRRAPPDVAQAEAEGTLVLLVDDHPLNRLLMLRQLNLLGYAAEDAEDGVQAFEKWKSGRFRLVLTDCEMPRMDGYDLARSIRTHEAATAGNRTPILACTAHPLAAVAPKCDASGMDACMAKPLSLAGLGEALDKWLPLPAGADAPLPPERQLASAGIEARHPGRED